MDMFKYLMGEEGEEDKGVFGSMIGREEHGWNFPGVVVNGKISVERMKVLTPAYGITSSLASTGLVAMRIFGNDVPDDIGEEIKTAIENVRGTMAKYIDGTVGAVGMKTAIEQGRVRATEIRKQLTAARRGRHNN